MVWYKNTKVERFIKETAEECGVTSDTVLEVLLCVFNTILEKCIGTQVKMFKIELWGSLTAKRYIPKRKNSKFNRKVKKYESTY